MKAGNFNINDYLEKLNEEAQGGQLPDKEGMVIPEENQKSYQWLKKEFQKARTEVKVEINMGGAKFEPGYDLQTDLKSVKDFKPGMFGEVKTADTPGKEKGIDNKTVDGLDAKKQKPTFGKGEGEKEEKEETPKTKGEPKDIKDKQQQKHEAGESEEKEEKEEHEAGESEEKEEKEEKEESKDGDTKVKKLDLKTKKK